MIQTPPAPPKSPRSGVASISPLAAGLVVILTYFGSQYAGAILLLLFGLALGMNLTTVEAWLSDSTVAQFAGGVIIYGLMVGVVYMVLKNYNASLRDIGLVRPRAKDIVIALAGILPYLIGYLILLQIVTVLFPAFDNDQKQQLGFDRSQNTTGLILTFISLVILPPLVEEIVMRGFLFTSFLKRYRFWVGALVTSVIFGVAHLQFGTGKPLLWAAAVDTFVLSLVLCYMRYKTGSLWPGIFLHALKNGVAFFSIFVFKLV